MIRLLKQPKVTEVTQKQSQNFLILDLIKGEVRTGNQIIPEIVFMISLNTFDCKARVLYSEFDINWRQSDTSWAKYGTPDYYFLPW